MNPLRHDSPPSSEAELLERCRAIAGLRLDELAAALCQALPPSARRYKGWTGQLLETALVTTAGNSAAPDFLQLGIELKTLPVDSRGKSLESTYISSVPLMQANLDWEASAVFHKLRRILWVPVETRADSALPERRIGAALLWSPDLNEASVLRQDWEELMEMVCRGQVESITAHQGNCLQIRPKAANANAQCWALDEQGRRFRTLPRGFYLRPAFTATILAKHYLI